MKEGCGTFHMPGTQNNIEGHFNKMKPGLSQLADFKAITTHFTYVKKYI